MSPTILIIDDVESSSKSIKKQLESFNYNVEESATIKKSIKIIESKKIDVILLDNLMGEDVMLELYKIIKSPKYDRSIPVITMVALDDMEGRKKAIDYGADQIIAKPCNDFALQSKIKSLIDLQIEMDNLRSNNFLEHVDNSEFTEYFSNIKFFVLESDAINAKIIHKSLSKISSNIKVGEKFNVENICEYKPDVILLGSSPKSDIMRIIVDIKSQYKIKDTSLILLVSQNNHRLAKKSAFMGALNYVFEPIEQYELLGSVKTLLYKRYYKKLSQNNLFQTFSISTKDGLTSLGNRYYFENQTQYIIRKSIHENKDLYIVVLSINKLAESLYSADHKVQVQILIQMSEILKKYCSGAELIARYNDKTFKMLYTGFTEDHITKIFKKVEYVINENDFTCLDYEGNSVKIQCPVSFIITKYLKNESVYSFLNRANNLLEKTQQKGRDKVLSEA